MSPFRPFPLRFLNAQFENAHTKTSGWQIQECPQMEQSINFFTHASQSLAHLAAWLPDNCLVLLPLLRFNLSKVNLPV